MDEKKFMDKTNERFTWMFDEFFKEWSSAKPMSPETKTRLLTKYFDHIIAIAALAAASSYHEQLREELKQHGIDIGPFSYLDINESDPDL